MTAHTDPGDARDVLATDAVCLLDVPVLKTGTAFTGTDTSKGRLLDGVVLPAVILVS